MTKASSLHDNRIFICVLLFSALFLLITRLIPFYQFGEAPLGYDTGFYLRSFGVNDYSMLSSTAYNLNIVPYFLLGMPPLLAISFIYVLSQLLIAGSLYFLFRSINIKSSLSFAAIAIFLFVISVTQFYAYWWMLGQQMLAMALIFVSVALLFRQPLLAILTGSFSMLLHIPTFAVFALSFLMFFIIQLMRTLFFGKILNKKLIYLFLFGLAIFLIGIALRYDDFLRYFNDYILVHHGTPNTYPFWEIGRLKGAFLEITKLRLTSILVLPMTIFAFIQPRVWKRAFKLEESLSDFVVFLYAMFVCLLTLVVFPVIYQQRFMIIFDFLLIIYATPVLVLIIQYFMKDKFTKFLTAMFFIIFFIEISLIAWSQQPHIDPSELTEIKALSVSAEGNAVVLATNSFYTPWVYGFSGRQAYGPGTPPDPWSYDKWLDFWTRATDENRLKILSDTYPAWTPLYLFIGGKQSQDMAFIKFIQNDGHFKKISEHVWRFN